MMPVGAKPNEAFVMKTAHFAKWPIDSSKWLAHPRTMRVTLGVKTWLSILKTVYLLWGVVVQ